MDKNSCQNCYESAENNDAYCEQCAHLLGTGELTIWRGKNCVSLIRTTVYEECDGLCEDCWNDILHQAFQQEIWDSQFEEQSGIDCGGV